MKVNFYILEQPNYQQALLFACNLIEDAYKKQQPVYIHASSLEEANKMDTLLWTFKDDSFLPHEIYNSPDSTSEARNDSITAPILIGHHVGWVSAQRVTQQRAQQPILVNLNKQIPDFHTQFQQIIEIVFSEPTVQQLARERYKQYRESGCDITTHKIKANIL